MREFGIREAGMERLAAIGYHASCCKIYKIAFLPHMTLFLGINVLSLMCNLTVGKEGIKALRTSGQL